MLLKLAFLFATGSICGWGLEVLFRRFFSAHHWVNPGFLVGPYLPLYGISLVTLYLLARLEPYISIADAWLRKLLLFFLMAIVITVIEFVTGMIFIHGMKVQLWDYSSRKGNIKGVICPTFSFFWMILSALYYFFIHPSILNALTWLSENLAFSFFVGLFYGVFLIDIVYSTQLTVKIRKFAKDACIVIHLEELREDIRSEVSRRKLNIWLRFFFPLRSRVPLQDLLKEYHKKQEETRKSIHEKFVTRDK